MTVNKVFQGDQIRALECEIAGLRKQLQDSSVLHRENEEKLELLLKAASTILESSSFVATARKIFDAGAKAIGARAGYVALLSEDGMENELLFLEDGGIECTVDHNLPMPIRGLRQESYKSGKVVYDNQFMRSEWQEFMPEGHMALPNVLFAPLNVSGKTVGIMGFSNKEGDFTPEDAGVAGTFGEYAAIALQNSRYISEIEQHVRDLDEMNATKDRFFSIIAHDLKNPFISIVGLIEVLQEEYREGNHSNIERYLTIIHDSATQSYDLLHNLLEWARFQTGRIQFSPKLINLSELAVSAAGPFASSLSAKDLDYQVEIDAQTEARVDPLMFDTILRNLISNAAKFTLSGGSITIRGQRDQTNLQLEFEDTGIGMGPDQLGKLFREDLKTSTPGLNNEKGTGLGLILCRDFVSMHSGEIRVESAPGKGTRFTIIVPQ